MGKKRDKDTPARLPEGIPLHAVNVAFSANSAEEIFTKLDEVLRSNRRSLTDISNPLMVANLPDLQQFHALQHEVIRRTLVTIQRTFHHELDSYASRLDNVQQPIIKNPALSEANKANMLKDTARSLQREELSIARHKQDYTDFASHIEDTRRTVTSHQHAISTLLTDLQHASAEPQKLPASKKLVTMLLESETLLVDYIRKSITHFPFNSESRQEHVQKNETLTNQVQTARNFANQHELTASQKLAHAKRQLNDCLDSLGIAGNSGEPSLKESQRQTSQKLIEGIQSLLPLISHATEQSDHLDTYDGKFKLAVGQLIKTADTFIRATKHISHLETLPADQHVSPRQTDIERKNFIANCLENLSLCHTMVAPEKRKRESHLSFTTFAVGLEKTWTAIKNLWKRLKPKTPEKTEYPTIAATKEQVNCAALGKQFLRSHPASIDGLSLMTQVHDDTGAITTFPSNKKSFKETFEHTAAANSQETAAVPQSQKWQEVAKKQPTFLKIR